MSKQDHWDEAIDGAVVALYKAMTERDVTTSKGLPSHHATLYLRLLDHPAVKEYLATPPTDMFGYRDTAEQLKRPPAPPHESALSSFEVDRTPKPAKEFYAIPPDSDYCKRFMVRTVYRDHNDNVSFGAVGPDPCVSYDHEQAKVTAKMEAQRSNGAARPVVIMGVTDVFLPPEIPAVNHYKVRKP
jgi:hypothetical protein